MKRILVILIIVAMLMCGSVAYAVEPSELERVEVASIGETILSGSNVYPYTLGTTGLHTTTTYKTIAYSTSGFDCNVYICCYNTTTNGLGVVPSSIRMLGASGNVLWEEYGAVPGLGHRIFYCGSDVYTIQIKTIAGLGTSFAYETTESPT